MCQLLFGNDSLANAPGLRNLGTSGRFRGDESRAGPEVGVAVGNPIRLGCSDFRKERAHYE